MGAAFGFPFTQSLLGPARNRSRGEWLASFVSWAGPASATQDDKIDRTERMVRDALARSDELSALSLKVIANGSSPNNTNMKIASDLDLIVVHEEPWYLPALGEQLPFVPAARSIATEHAAYRQTVLSALQSAFEWWNVEVDNKCLRLAATDNTRVACDVLPSFRLRQYLPLVVGHAQRVFVEGVVFVTTAGEWVVSYPEQHLANGRAKNLATGYRYKQIVRVVKKLKANIEELATILTAHPLPASFEIESFIYNAPDSVLTTGDLFDGVVGSLRWASERLGQASTCNTLTEPNGFKRLFPFWRDAPVSLLAGAEDGIPAEVMCFRRFVQRSLELIGGDLPGQTLASIFAS